MPEPLDIDAMEAHYRGRANPWDYADQLALIAECRSLRAELSDQAERFGALMNEYVGGANGWRTRAERAEAAIARVEALRERNKNSTDPITQGWMFVLGAALRGDS